jgi:5-methylcytosine-specific restriction protein A
MPSALLRPCGYAGGCPELVVSGCCPAHTRQAEQRRGSAHARGYTRAWAQRKARYIQRLINLGIAPVCGARLPGAAATTDSVCQQEGRFVGDSGNGRALELDHIVPHEGDPALFNDDLNLQLLCRRDHSAKTLREQQAR